MNSQIKYWVIHFIDLFPRLRNLAFRKLRKSSPFSSSPEQSDSEETSYVKSIEIFLSSEKHFKNFRRNYNYREILEHVSFPMGKRYLEQIKRLIPSFDALSYHKLKPDAVGNPVRYIYPGFQNSVSPTLIRYMFVYFNLLKFFKFEDIRNIAEIGIGFGGQISVIDQLSPGKTFHVYDLPVVQELSKRYFRELGVNPIVELKNIYELQETKYGLVISNYAFSELPSQIQKEYLIKILSKAKCGYLTMNSGKTNYSGRNQGKMSLEEILKYLPDAIVLNEEPLTGPDNYLIVWGQLDPK